LLVQELGFLFVKEENMKKRLSIYLNVILLVIVFTMVFGQFAVGSNPGGPNDPVVTQSYVEGRLQALNAEIQSQITSLDTGTAASGQAFEVVAVNAGQSIILEENSQFILRTGEATAIAGPGGGLSDLTAGIDLLTNDLVSRNHLLLIPRSDGRGVYFKTSAWIMVSGKYILE